MMQTWKGRKNIEDDFFFFLYEMQIKKTIINTYFNFNGISVYGMHKN